MPVDHRVMRALCQGWRDSDLGFGDAIVRDRLPAIARPWVDTGWERPWPVDSLWPAAEELSRTGYLRKLKVGSKVAYARGAEERVARPDLPDGWFYCVHLSFPAGVRTETVLIDVAHWHPHGSAMTIEPRKMGGVDVAAIVIPPWNPRLPSYGSRATKQGYDTNRAWVLAEARRQGLQTLDGDAGLSLPSTRPYMERTPSERFAVGFYDPDLLATGKTEAVIWAPLSDRPAALKVAKLAWDLAFRIYNEERR